MYYAAVGSDFVLMAVKKHHAAVIFKDYLESEKMEWPAYSPDFVNIVCR